MAQGKRVEVFEAQRTDIWQRWKVGQSLHEIGRAYGRTPSSIHLLLSHHGGIVPAVRRRSPQALTLTGGKDREKFWALNLPPVNCKQVLHRPTELARLFVQVKSHPLEISKD